MGEPHLPENTRERILHAAFEEFYRHGFRGGSLNHIVDDAKGALFHHFVGKQELGHAVVDEIIWPHFKTTWVDPLEHSADPIRDITRLLRHMAENRDTGGNLVQGSVTLP